MNTDQVPQSTKSKQGRVSHGVFAFTVLLGYGITFSYVDIQPSSPVGIALIGICIVDILPGTFGFEWIEQQHDSKSTLEPYGLYLRLRSSLAVS